MGYLFIIIEACSFLNDLHHNILQNKRGVSFFKILVFEKKLYAANCLNMLLRFLLVKLRNETHLLQQLRSLTMSRHFNITCYQRMRYIYKVHSERRTTLRLVKTIRCITYDSHKHAEYNVLNHYLTGRCSVHYEELTP
jgi:hypothetical protein